MNIQLYARLWNLSNYLPKQGALAENSLLQPLALVMLWILTLCYQGRGDEEFECSESIRKRKICDEIPFFQIIILSKINDRILLMCSKSYQKQEIKRPGSGTLKFFIISTFNIASCKGVYYDLSFDFVCYFSIHYPPA